MLKRCVGPEDRFSEAAAISFLGVAIPQGSVPPGVRMMEFGYGRVFLPPKSMWYELVGFS